MLNVIKITQHLHPHAHIMSTGAGVQNRNQQTGGKRYGGPNTTDDPRLRKNSDKFDRNYAARYHSNLRAERQKRQLAQVVEKQPRPVVQQKAEEPGRSRSPTRASTNKREKSRNRTPSAKRPVPPAALKTARDAFSYTVAPGFRSETFPVGEETPDPEFFKRYAVHRYLAPWLFGENVSIADVTKCLIPVGLSPVVNGQCTIAAVCFIKTKGTNHHIGYHTEFGKLATAYIANAQPPNGVLPTSGPPHNDPPFPTTESTPVNASAVPTQQLKATDSTTVKEVW